MPLHYLYYHDHFVHLSLLTSDHRVNLPVHEIVMVMMMMMVIMMPVLADIKHTRLPLVGSANKTSDHNSVLQSTLESFCNRHRLWYTYPVTEICGA